MSWQNQPGKGPGVGLLLVALITVSGAAFPSSAQSNAQEWPETVVVIGEPRMDHEGTYQEWDCDGEQLALLVTDHPGCGDFGGQHVRGGWSYLIMGFRSTNAGNHGQVPLTGALEAKIAWENRDMTLHCIWDNGEFQECLIVISKPPPPGTPFTFTCESTHGSYGGWSECFIGHG